MRMSFIEPSSNKVCSESADKVVAHHAHAVKKRSKTSHNSNHGTPVSPLLLVSSSLVSCVSVPACDFHRFC